MLRARLRSLAAPAVLAAGLAGCAAPPPSALPAPDLRGEWTLLDTLVQTFELDDGEIIETRTLWGHLTVSDSAWTQTVVSQGPGAFGPTAYTGRQAAFTYRTFGDSLALDVDPPNAPASSAFSIRGDTLVLSFEPDPGDPVRQRFVRSEPLRIPPALLGFWVGLSEPDAAGVPAEIGLRFNADGTFENGWGEPEGPFVVAGPYLLLGSRHGPDFGEARPLLGTLFGTVMEMDLDPAAEVEPGVAVPTLRLRDGATGEGLVLYRRSP